MLGPGWRGRGPAIPLQLLSASAGACYARRCGPIGSPLGAADSARTHAPARAGKSDLF
ncbi:hypothetical protein HMPREF3198_02023 [Winkia neuii]|nr:hypothetical protein HMPREF3198_02023 [Winkia neuii]